MPRLSASYLGMLMIGLLILVGCQSDEERVATFLERGQEYVDSDQPEEAIIEFKNVLQIDPENPEAHEALSIAYLVVKKPREAYWEMSETVRLDASNVDARLRYGTVAAAIGDYDLSLEQAEAVLALDPSNSAAFVMRGQAREAQEDYEGAEADYQAAIESDPTGAAFRFLLAGFYERRGERDKSEQTLRELIEVEESFLAVSTLTRIVSRDQARDAESARLLEKTIELAKNAPTERPARGSEEGQAQTTSLKPNVLREAAVKDAYKLLAAFHNERGRFDEAIAALEAGVQESESKVDLIYQMARLYRLEGNTEKEKALIERASQESPGNMEAQLILSAYLGQQGDLDGALKAALAAKAINPKNTAARLREAELRVDLGYQHGDAESIKTGREIVSSVLDEEPDSPEAFFVRAKIEIADGDLEAAKESLEAVLQSRPEWAQARFVLGSALAASRELSRARVELARAVEIDPQLSAARQLLAKVHARLGEHEFAIEQGRIYLEQNPDDSDVRIVVGQSLIRIGRPQEAYDEVSKIPEDQRDAAAYFALGRLDLAFGRTELGAERLRKADELSPGNPQVLRSLLALDRASENLDASAKRIALALEANSEDTELAELDAEIKLLRGDPDGARASLERAVELDPRNSSAQLALADLEARAGNVDEMIAVMERAAAAVPESSDLQYRLAAFYEKVGRRSDAITTYEKAISLNNDLAAAKNNLAYLLTETGGDLDRALELAQQAKQQLPHDGNAADTLGWVLLKRGVPSAAIGYLKEATQRFPANALEIQGIVRNHLAEAYELNREADKAIAESKKSIDYSETLAKAAKEQGADYAEPEWSRQARARIARLGADS
jgi:tetratricopeptide (TPR) repeat protein